MDDTLIQILFMLHLCARLNLNFATATKYVIKNSSYLIETPPKRPANSFLMFAIKKLKGKSDISVSEEMIEASQKWKLLTEEEKKKYQDKSTKLFEDYYVKKEDYHKKYEVPFTNVSYNTLAISSFYKNKQVNVEKGAKFTEYSKQTTELFKNLTPEQVTQFKVQAEKIKQERNKAAEQFQFPQRLYHSQSGFTRAHPQLLPPQRKSGYKAYVAQWEVEVEQWLIKNSIALKLPDFLRLYNRTLKKKKENKDEE